MYISKKLGNGPFATISENGPIASISIGEGDEAQSINMNLDVLQRDFPISVSVYLDGNGELSLVESLAEVIVATFSLPRAKYDESEEGDSVRLPIDMKSVAITLWSI